GLCNGFVNWNSYGVHVDGGTFDKGIVTLFPDPRKVSDVVKITVTPYYYPDLKQEIDLPVSYKVKYVASCKGQNGLGGFDGLSGAELHQMDTQNKWHVYNGRKGQNGTDGENGSDGCIADVFVKSMTLSGKKMMNVLVINHCDNSHLVYWIDPDGGSLVVDVSGGDGGNGGKGGDGENGVDGAGADPKVGPTGPSYYDGQQLDFNPQYVLFNGPYAPNIDLSVDSTRNPTGNGGDGGYGGNGGKAGNGGSGGIAVIHLDSSAVQWENKITVISKGGKSGNAGPGGYAGKGGKAAYNMFDKTNGETGFMGAEGIKGEAGKPGSPAILRKENVKMVW
ncbi:MAG TPA: hypothetical protein VFJ43_00025, partial [Bacteroidia bacterium]|nr:hypothetical protein [Bacteroidia bacterium]